MGNKLGIGNTFAQIGTVNSNQGNYKLALQYLNRALEIHIKLGNRIGVELDYLSIGNIYIKCGEYNKGLQYNKKALKLHNAGRPPVQNKRQSRQ